ncbi:BAM_G0000920.mRNA.1.CDS.1 [Saccharomyces cerevisiae]|nr:BAM_G0000920.mRNA.1.CDS.1 [Saccharomyces cerevisiae]CAI7035737.1 BAM_G0000920.mRNA.1.CDS.1 [Saccharomyces cerevisiae]
MKDNEIGDGKSVDVLSVKRLGIPKRLFYLKMFSETNRFGFVMEMSKSLVFASGCYYGYHLASGGNFRNNWIYPLIVSLLVCFGTILSLLFVDFPVSVPYRETTHSVLPKRLLKTHQVRILRHWEVVAANLNSYFYENKAWNTKVLFSMP